MIEFTYVPKSFPAPSDSRPLVTHFLKVYNQRKYVRDVLESVLSQDYNPLEVVISDNASTDGSRELILEILHKYRDKSGSHVVVYNRNSENLGVARNAEVCLKLAKGDICIQNDGDDISLPHRASKIVEAFQKFPEAMLVESLSHKISESNEKTTCSVYTGEMTLLESDPNKVVARLPCYRGAVLAYRKSCLNHFGDVPADAWADDIIFSYRCVLFGKVVHIDEPLIYYRTDGGISTTRSKTLEHSVKINRARTKCYEQLLCDVRGLNAIGLKVAEECLLAKIKNGMDYVNAVSGDGIFSRLISAVRFMFASGVTTRTASVLLLSVCPKTCREFLFQYYGK